MYDKYPVYDVPQSNFIQRFFAQRWSAILVEIALTIVITVAAGRAFDFFDPFERESVKDAPAATELRAEPASVALEPFTLRGMAYLQNREFAAAEAMYDFAIAVAPEDADNYVWRGYVNMLAGDYFDAQTDFHHILESEPADYDAHTVSLLGIWRNGRICCGHGALQQCRKFGAVTSGIRNCP